MGPKDRAHFISKCRKLKLPWPAIAQALSMDAKSVKDFVARRTAKSQDGKTVILPSSAKQYAGKTLDSQEEHYVRTEQGYGGPPVHVSILINALKARSVIPNQKAVAAMRELRLLIDSWLAENES
jgi:hypothetical protein